MTNLAANDFCCFYTWAEVHTLREKQKWRLQFSVAPKRPRLNVVGSIKGKQMLTMNVSAGKRVLQTVFS